jgi:hypothetical protein
MMILLQCIDPNGLFFGGGFVGMMIGSIGGMFNQYKNAAANTAVGAKVISSIRSMADLIETVHLLYSGISTTMIFLMSLGDKSIDILDTGISFRPVKDIEIFIKPLTIDYDTTLQHPLDLPCEITITVDLKHSKISSWLKGQPLLSGTFRGSFFKALNGGSCLDVLSGEINVYNQWKQNFGESVSPDGSQDSFGLALNLGFFVNVGTATESNRYFMNRKIEFGVWGSFTAGTQSVYRDKKDLTFQMFNTSLSFHLGFDPVLYF